MGFGSVIDEVSRRIDRCFTSYAKFIGKAKVGEIILVCGLLLLIILSPGLFVSKTEKDLEALWVDQDSRIVDEKREYERFFGGTPRAIAAATTNADKSPIFSRTATPGLPAAQDVLQSQIDAMKVWARETVTYQGRTYKHSDFCQRPLAPRALQPLSQRTEGSDNITGSLSTAYQNLTDCLATDRDFTDFVYPLVVAQYELKQLVPAQFTPLPPGWGISEFPCSRASVLDCFREGQEVDYSEELKQLQVVAGAVAFYSRTVQAMVDTLGQTPVQQVKLIDLYNSMPCWLRNVTGTTSCLQGSLQQKQAAIANQTVFLRRLFHLPVDNSSSLRLNATKNALDLDNVTKEVQTELLIGLNGSEHFQVVAYYITLQHKLQSPSGGSKFLTHKCDRKVADHTAHYTGFARPQIEHILHVTVQLMSSFGYWWRKSFRDMSSAEVLEHFTEAAATAVNADVTIDTCIVKRRACCMTWNGIVIGNALIMGGGKRATAQSVQGKVKSEVFDSITAIASSLTDYNANHPLWPSILQERHPSMAWKSHTDREALAKAFDKKLTASWLRLYQRRPGSKYEEGAAYRQLKFDFVTGVSLNDIIADATVVPTALLATSYIIMIAYIIFCLGNYGRAVRYLMYGTKRKAVQQIVKSHSLLGLAGVAIVAASTVASIGLASFCTVKLNGISLNLVPFVSLGLGIDDMFVLIHTLSARFSSAKRPEENLVQTLQIAGPSVLLTSVANSVAFLLVVIIPINIIRQLAVLMAISVAMNFLFLLLLFVPCMLFDLRRRASNRMDFIMIRVKPDEDEEKKENKLEIDDGASKEEPSLVVHFVANYYAPFITHPVTKVVILVVFVAAFSVLVWSGVKKTEHGFQTSDIALKDTYQRDAAELSETVLVSTAVDLVSISKKAPISNTTARKKLFGAFASLDKSPWSVQGSPVTGTAWLMSSATSMMGFYALAGNVLLTEPSCKNVTANLPVMTKACFEEFFPTWFDLIGVAYSSDMYCRNGSGDAPFVSCGSPNATVAVSVFRVYVQNLRTHQAHYDAIKDLRRRVDAWSDENVRLFMYGGLFNFFEQYFNISDTLLKAIAFGLLGVFIVTFLFQLNPWLSVIICTTIFMITMELYGLSYPLGIKLNAISMANFCVSIGIAVEFTAHVARAFLLASGTRNERACQALKEMMSPMLHGAMSTILSIVILVANKFPFFRLYYATMFSIMVFVAFINGLVFLPVLLSLIGPLQKKAAS